jgi:hypothetical protein
LPIDWGNRNWHPLLPETLRKMKQDGLRRGLGFVTSAYSSYSGCQQHREDIARAQNEIGPEAVATIRHGNGDAVSDINDLGISVRVGGDGVHRASQIGEAHI